MLFIIVAAEALVIEHIQNPESLLVKPQCFQRNEYSSCEYTCDLKFNVKSRCSVVEHIVSASDAISYIYLGQHWLR